jgi:tripartite-type tricarboxylate transporter receptor subunit TctC
MKKKSIMILGLAVSIFFFSTGIAPCADPDYPRKPITFVIWADPGSGFDIWGRTLCTIAEKYFKQPIVYVSKTGGNTNEAMGYLLNQPADGYTISAWSNSLAGFINMPGYVAKPEDFDPLMITTKQPYMLVVGKESPFKTLKEFLTFAKLNPGKLSVGGSRVGSVHHQNTYAMAKEAGVNLTYVPYRGTGAVLKDIMGGHISGGILSPGTALSQLQSGLARSLVVFDSNRVSLLPDVPSMKDLGFKFMGIPIEHGIQLKKGVPTEIKAKMLDVYRKVLKDPEFISFVAKIYQGEIYYLGPEELTRHFIEDIKETRAYLVDLKILK